MISVVSLEVASARQKRTALEPCLHTFLQQVLVERDSAPGYEIGPDARE